MATYVEIQAYVRKNYGFQPKSCWIAHVKEMCGLPRRNAHNRISADNRRYPCPLEKASCIKEAFLHFGMIQ